MIFSHASFHVGVRQINQNMILHAILDVYPSNISIDKKLSIFIKIVCDVTHNKSFGLGLKYVAEVRRNLVYIIGDIFVFF